MASTVYEFDAVLTRLEGKIAWTVIYAPFSVREEFGTDGRLSVKVTVDGNVFDGTLLPSRNGHYIVYNTAMKRLCRKALGESVHVVMEQDTGVRTVDVPEDVRAFLEADPGSLERFNQMPEYRKREEIARINDARRPETREKRIRELPGRI